MKPLILVTAPVQTRSGYGNHSRDICSALVDLDKYDVRINPCRWGNTPLNALEKGNSQHEKIVKHMLSEPKTERQPDLHLHIVIPNEFANVGKRNIGMTAGIETTIPQPAWVAGCNKMDEVVFVSEFAKQVFKNSEFEEKDKKNVVKLEKPSSVLFEGVDTNVYKPIQKIGDGVNSLFEDVEEDFNFLFTGHWLQGQLGEDRKDLGMLIKVFCETFKGQKKQPGLILKTSGPDFSIIDREDIVSKINHIKKSVNGKIPNIYFIHGDLEDSEMNEMYNHPKVKAHISFTHGEGFGRPLLEAAQSGKPVIAPNWSGQVDFLNENYAVLLQGSLTSVPEGAFPKEVFYKNTENKWFTVNYNHAQQVMKDVVKNYPKYLIKGKQLQAYTKQKFSYDKMKEELDIIISNHLESLPKQVELKLPKLKKV
tara:strand:+ start:6964 stop:8232 length:1269 start_codon:yes stop_codon:yes gene_type:complete